METFLVKLLKECEEAHRAAQPIERGHLAREWAEWYAAYMAPRITAYQFYCMLPEPAKSDTPGDGITEG